MATVSFNKPLEIRSDKSASALIKASMETDSHKPIKRVDISRERESGLSSLRKKYSH
jgi:hypothetical protein